MNRLSHCLLATAIAVALAAPVAAESPLIQTEAVRIESEGDVADVLDRAGYRDITVLEFDGGLWLTEAATADGQRMRMYVDPADSRVHPIAEAPDAAPEPAIVLVPAPSAPLTENDVRALLTDVGYHDIDDIEFDDGIWKAEVRDAAGEDFEIHLDPAGRIVHVEDD